MELILGIVQVAAVILAVLGGLWGISKAYFGLRSEIRAIKTELEQGKKATSGLEDSIEEAILRLGSAQRTMGIAEAWSAEAKGKAEAALRHLDIEIRPDIKRLNQEVAELRGGLKVEVEGLRAEVKVANQNLQSLVAEVREMRGQNRDVVSR